VVSAARRAGSSIVNRVIAGSLMLSVWLAGVLPGPVPLPMRGMSHPAAPAQGAMTGHQGQAAVMCDRSDNSDPCTHCGAGACLTMQGCSTTGCLVLYQASVAGALSQPGHPGSILAMRVVWRTRSLAPPTPPPLGIRDQRA
jgi:hypothetical protein